MILLAQCERQHSNALEKEWIEKLNHNGLKNSVSNRKNSVIHLHERITQLNQENIKLKTLNNQLRLQIEELQTKR